jgi:DNA-binding beta-propeller fold protein YncE
MSRAVSVTIALLFAVCGSARQLPTDESAPLVLVRIIPIPGVVGRFDHMAVDNNGGRVFAAVHGNDSVEVVDTTRGRRDGSVKEGFNKPQMVAYLPDLNRIVVSNEGDGSCKILDANTYQLIDTVKFSDDAAIGVFDATTNKKIGGDFEVGAHPESFQLEEKGPRIFVNPASANQFLEARLHLCGMLCKKAAGFGLNDGD